MSTDYWMTVHEIAKDGLPDLNDRKMTGRVAFIYDGCIVSGWPLVSVNALAEGEDIPWEANSDVGYSDCCRGVTHWVEFQVPLASLAKAKP